MQSFNQINIIFYTELAGRLIPQCCHLDVSSKASHGLTSPSTQAAVASVTIETLASLVQNETQDEGRRHFLTASSAFGDHRLSNVFPLMAKRLTLSWSQSLSLLVCNLYHQSKIFWYPPVWFLPFLYGVFTSFILMHETPVYIMTVLPYFFCLFIIYIDCFPKHTLSSFFETRLLLIGFLVMNLSALMYIIYYSFVSIESI